MAISVGEIEATLRLKDAMSPAFAAASAKMNASLTEMQAKLNAARQNVADLTKAVNQFKDSSGKPTLFVEELAAAKAQATILAAQMTATARAVNDYAAAARAAGTAAQNIADTNQRVFNQQAAEANRAADAVKAAMVRSAQAQIDGAQRASAAQQKAAEDARRAVEAHIQAQRDSAQAMLRTAEAMGSVGRAMSIFITAPLVAAGTASTKFAADFERDMVKVSTLSNIAASEIGHMREQIMKMAPETGQGPDALSKALLVVTSTGIQGAEAMDILRQSAKASAVGLGDTRDIARAVTAAIKAYGSENLTASHAIEALFIAVKEGGAEATSFANTLGRVMSIAQQGGVSFDELVANIATFTRLGVSAEEAVTGIRGTLSALTLKEAPQSAKALAQFGLTVQDVKKSIRDNGLADTLIHLVKITGDNDEAMAKIIPNVRALASVFGVAGSQAEDYRKIVAHVKDGHAEFVEAFRLTQGTAAFQWDQLKAKVQALAIELGDKLLPIFLKLIPDIEKFLGKVSELIDEFGKLPAVVQEFAVASLAVLAVGGPVLIAVGALARAWALVRLAIIAAKEEQIGFSLPGVGGPSGGGGRPGGGIGFLPAAETMLGGTLALPSLSVVDKRSLEERTADYISQRQAGALAGLGAPGTPSGVFGAAPSSVNFAATWAEAAKHQGEVLPGTAAMFGPLLSGSSSLEAGGALPGKGATLTDAEIKTQRETAQEAIRKVEESMGKLDEQALKLQQAEEMADVKSQIQFLDTTHERQLGSETFGYPKFANGNFTGAGLAGPTPVRRAAQQNIADMKPQGFTTSLFSDIGKDLPQIIVASLEGGGNAVKAVSAGIGNKIGSNLVKSFGTSITNHLGKTFGGAINDILPGLGALAAPLIDFLGKMLDHSAKDFKRAGKEMGVEFSDEFIKQLKTDSKKYGGEVQAILMNLDKVIAEAGGVLVFGIDKAIAKTRDLFVMLSSGKLTAQQVGSEFDKVFAQILPEAIDKTTGLAKKSFIELITLSHELGVDSEAAAKFLLDQSTKITGGLNLIAAGTIGAFNRATEAVGSTGDDLVTAREKVEKLQAQIADLNKKGITTNTQRAQMDIWIRQLADAQTAVTMLESEQREAAKTFEDAAKGGQVAFDRLGRLASVAFAAALGNGRTFTEALADIGPTLDEASKAQQTFGFTSSGTFDELMKFRKFATDNKELVQTLEGVTQMMVGLNNSGALTQETFNDLTAISTETFDKMVAGGLTGKQALVLMQPDLQTIWELQQKFGLTVDEGTQALLNQGIEAGIVGEKHKSAAERMVTALDHVTTVLEAIALFMGVKLPEAAADGASGIQDEFNKHPPVIHPRIDWPDLSPGEGDGGGDGNGDGSRGDGGNSSWQGGFVMPGTVRHMAMGGWVPSGKDTVRALLAPGEGVVNHMGMGTLGVGGLNTLNHGGSLGNGGGDTYHVTIHVDATTFEDMMKRPGGGIDMTIEDLLRDKRGRFIKVKRKLSDNGNTA